MVEVLRVVALVKVVTEQTPVRVSAELGGLVALMVAERRPLSVAELVVGVVVESAELVVALVVPGGLRVSLVQIVLALAVMRRLLGRLATVRSLVSGGFGRFPAIQALV